MGDRLKKVVVTGGAGFIGSYLAEELARQGYHVIILDDTSSKPCYATLHVA